MKLEDIYGKIMNRKKIARIMKELNLKTRTRWKNTYKTQIKKISLSCKVVEYPGISRGEKNEGKEYINRGVFQHLNGWKLCTAKSYCRAMPDLQACWVYGNIY